MHFFLISYITTIFLACSVCFDGERNEPIKKFVMADVQKAILLKKKYLKTVNLLIW